MSLDHYDAGPARGERGAGSWAPTIDGLLWLAAHGFALAVAGRTASGEPEPALRAGYAALFAELGLRLDARDPGGAGAVPGDDR